MKKFFLILFIILLSISPISAKTLQGGVEHVDAQIKNMKLKKDLKKLPKSFMAACKVDPDFDEHKAAMEKGLKKVKDRHLLYTGSGNYRVIYESGPMISFMYDSIGNLTNIAITIEYKSSEYEKFLLYNSDGILRYVIIEDSNGVMSAYDLDGNFVLKSK